MTSMYETTRILRDHIEANRALVTAVRYAPDATGNLGYLMQTAADFEKTGVFGQEDAALALGAATDIEARLDAAAQVLAVVGSETEVAARNAARLALGIRSTFERMASHRRTDTQRAAAMRGQQMDA